MMQAVDPACRHCLHRHACLRSLPQPLFAVRCRPAATTACRPPRRPSGQSLDATVADNRQQHCHRMADDTSVPAHRPSPCSMQKVTGQR